MTTLTSGPVALATCTSACRQVYSFDRRPASTLSAKIASSAGLRARHHPPRGVGQQQRIVLVRARREREHRQRQGDQRQRRRHAQHNVAPVAVRRRAGERRHEHVREAHGSRDEANPGVGARREEHIVRDERAAEHRARQRGKERERERDASVPVHGTNTSRVLAVTVKGVTNAVEIAAIAMSGSRQRGSED